MTANKPSGCRRVALVASDGLTESDLLVPMEWLRNAGFHVELIGGNSPEIHLLRRHSDGATEKVSMPETRGFSEVSPERYQFLALVAPVLRDNPLDVDSSVLELIHRMQSAGKPVVFFSPQPGPPKAEAPRRPAFNIRRLVADSWRNWNAIEAPRLGAALAFYSLLALAPLMILCMVVAGVVFERTAVEGRLLWEIRNLMGSQVAHMVRDVLDHSSTATGVIAGAASLMTLLLGASGLFLELRNALDTVWGAVPQYGDSLKSLIQSRIFAFLLVLGTVALVFLFVGASAVFATPARLLWRFLPGRAVLSQLIGAGGAFAGMTLVFALIYKVIPDIYIHWSDVWIGALATAALFTGGKALIDLYLAHVSVGSAYAAAGSMVVFLIWVYYSAQIFLLGAEFTHVYAFRHGTYSRPRKTPNVRA